MAQQPTTDPIVQTVVNKPNLEEILYKSEIDIDRADAQLEYYNQVYNNIMCTGEDVNKLDMLYDDIKKLANHAHERRKFLQLLNAHVSHMDDYYKQSEQIQLRIALYGGLIVQIDQLAIRATKHMRWELTDAELAFMHR